MLMVLSEKAINSTNTNRAPPLSNPTLRRSREPRNITLSSSDRQAMGTLMVNSQFQLV